MTKATGFRRLKQSSKLSGNNNNGLRQYTAARPSRVPLLAILSRMISGCLVVVYRQLEFGSGWSLNQHFFGPCDLILMVRLAL